MDFLSPFCIVSRSSNMKEWSLWSSDFDTKYISSQTSTEYYLILCME